jgi:hypothetical protein
VERGKREEESSSCSFSVMSSKLPSVVSNNTKAMFWITAVFFTTIKLKGTYCVPMLLHVIIKTCTINRTTIIMIVIRENERT